jgi:thioredoxin 2
MTVVITCPNCQHRNRVPTAAKGVPRCGKCKQPLPWIVDAGDQDFAEVVEQGTMPVLVDVWAPWCGPCRLVSPVLEELAIERAGEVKLVRVNADEAPAVSQRFNVASIPTLLVLRDGQVVAERIGAAPATALRPWLRDALTKEAAR